MYVYIYLIRFLRKRFATFGARTHTSRVVFRRTPIADERRRSPPTKPGHGTRPSKSQRRIRNILPSSLPAPKDIQGTADNAPGRDSSKVGSSRLSNSFMTISHTGWLRLGQFCAFPLHLCGIRKNSVYGQMGTRPSDAVMDASYTKNWCSIIWNCLLPPTRRYGARMPTIDPSDMLANLCAKNCGY